MFSIFSAKLEKPFDKYRHNVYSQNGEDGIIEELLRLFKLKDYTNLWCVEYGDQGVRGCPRVRSRRVSPPRVAGPCRRRTAYVAWEGPAGEWL